jgi:hypothetical protein
MKIADLQPNLLVQTKAHQVLKISTIHNDHQVSAKVVYPAVPRRADRFYTAADVAEWRTPSPAMIRKYEQAWGFAAKLPPTWHRVAAAPKPRSPVAVRPDRTPQPSTPRKGAGRP